MKEIQTNFGKIYYYPTPRNTFHACGFGVERQTVEELIKECERRYYAPTLDVTNHVPYSIGYAHACGYHD